MLRIILNVLWLIFGGLEMAVAWWIVAVIFAITIIGLPWARGAFNIGIYTLWPFGSEAMRRDALSGREDIGTGPLGMLGNVVWFILAGWWLALGHLFIALLWAITLIGLPFAYVHFKLVPITLFPIGMTVASREGALRPYPPQR